MNAGYQLYAYFRINQHYHKKWTQIKKMDSNHSEKFKWFNNYCGLLVTASDWHTHFTGLVKFNRQ